MEDWMSVRSGWRGTAVWRRGGGRLVAVEHVAHAAHRLDVVAGGAELLAHPLDVGVDVARGHVGVGAPEEGVVVRTNVVERAADEVALDQPLAPGQLADVVLEVALEGVAELGVDHPGELIADALSRIVAVSDWSWPMDDSLVL